MKLSPLHQKTLTILGDYHKSAPTLGRILQRSFVVYLIIVPLFLGAAAVAFHFTYDLFGWIVIGLLLGCLVRDLGWFRRTVVLWPLHDDIINWDRVDELLTSSGIASDGS